jgi:hypothetical protein
MAIIRRFWSSLARLIAGSLVLKIAYSIVVLYLAFLSAAVVWVIFDSHKRDALLLVVENVTILLGVLVVPIFLGGTGIFLAHQAVHKALHKSLQRNAPEGTDRQGNAEAANPPAGERVNRARDET